MSIKIVTKFTNVKPPKWSGNTTCQYCGSKRCTSEGGMFYENNKTYIVSKTFCFDCKQGETIDTRK